MTPHGLPFLNSSLRIPDPDLTGSEKHRRGQKESSKTARKNKKKNGKKWHKKIEKRRERREGRNKLTCQQKQKNFHQETKWYKVRDVCDPNMCAEAWML